MSEPTSNTRRNLFIAAGLGAAAIGAGLSLRHRVAEPAPLSAAAMSFWSARFDRPDGGEMLAAGFKGQPLLLNFWATWCPPCVKELPELAQFQREFKGKGWQVAGLAVDSPSAVRDFLKKLSLDFPVGLAGLTGTELTRTLGNSQGGLPFSVAFNAAGELIWRKLGATNLDELRQMASKFSPT
ncbi:TlpA family protein disulfide reductase [Paucibacter sp. TC2R-5]|uniref:TlpA disulfide reductase family protein n=1 Tax=Paucibacter sp. TC2R-5 TaxID=2893555 RepID=UPI0021E46FAE|nr:TlpA disulfide reductase family protein [Paucibacter sp. TC2R-5]MCV2361405.1 TlpA family protein disulfide reductase [Paucibacter sp. TC2R-5]